MSLSKAALARWDLRLHNWALFVVGHDGGGSVAISGAYSLVGRGRPSEGDAIEALVGEAMDVDALVRKLINVLQMAIIAEYVWSGTPASKALELDCHVNTLANRVDAAIHELDTMDARRRRFQAKSAHGVVKTGA